MILDETEELHWVLSVSTLWVGMSQVCADVPYNYYEARCFFKSNEGNLNTALEAG